MCTAKSTTTTITTTINNWQLWKCGQTIYKNKRKWNYICRVFWCKNL